MNSVQLLLMGEAKFGSDCVAMRQNFSDADGIDLIKCRGKYNSWNGRNTNHRKCTFVEGWTHLGRQRSLEG